MKTPILMLAMAMACLSTTAQTLEIQWQRCFGGTNIDLLTAVQPTSDGGYVVCGHATSGPSGSKASTNYGGSDYWIVKLDANGNQTWEQSFGGTVQDVAQWLIQTNGQYVILGTSTSGVSGNKASTNYGSSDIWAIKLDANGNKLWDQSYGGTSLDSALDLEPTSDGGFIIAGLSASGINGNKTAPNYGGVGDGWAVKLDGNGNKVWDQSYGGTVIDGFRCVRPANSGGFVFAGNSSSPISGNKTSANYGAGDYWIVKTDAAGNKELERSFGGTGNEIITDLHQTSDNGWILGGWSSSPISGTKTTTNYGGNDFWIIKLDAAYNQQWERNYGGSGADDLRSIFPTSDGGYIAAGGSASGISGNKTNASFGTNDYWVIKLDSNGNKIAEWSFGGTGDDTLYGLQPTSDGGYILGGYSSSAPSGNKTVPNFGITGYWVVKIGTPIPRLNVARSGSNISLSWPSPSTGFSLEQNTNFSANWSNVVQTPNDDGTNKNIILPANLDRAFFRLRRP